MDLTSLNFPKYELKEIFECSTKSRFEFQNLRFLLTDGQKAFFMRPQLVKKNALRLCCYSSQDSSKRYPCKASIMLQFKADIRTEFDGNQRRIASSTSKDVLMSTSSYTVLTHLVKTLQQSLVKEYWELRYFSTRNIVTFKLNLYANQMESAVSTHI